MFVTLPSLSKKKKGLVLKFPAMVDSYLNKIHGVIHDGVSGDSIDAMPLLAVQTHRKEIEWILVKNSYSCLSLTEKSSRVSWHTVWNSVENGPISLPLPLKYKTWVQ